MSLNAENSGQPEFEDEVSRLEGLLAALQGLSDPTARSAAQELAQVVMRLHGLGLADVLAVVREAGSQPADTLLPKFAANPRISGLLLLHDLHPDDLATRARRAVDRLRPHLGVQGVHADLDGVADNVVRISVTASGQKSNRPAATALRREIEETVMEMVPDAADVIIAGLGETSGSGEAYVPLASITRAGAAGNRT